MPKYVRLHIESLQMSWGEYAGDSYRGTRLYPTRSGIVGLLAASLGLLRGDPRIQELHSQIRVHSRVLKEGKVVTDYQNHTQYAKDVQKGTKQILDHRLAIFDLDLVSVGTVATQQSWRYYLEGAAFEVLVEVRPGTFTEEQLNEAAKHPKFFQYFGRKNCAPFFPVATGIEEGESPLKCFRLPKPTEVLGDLSEYQGKNISLDMDNLPKEGLDDFIIIPETVRDAAKGERFFHQRKGWILTPTAKETEKCTSSQSP